MWEPGNSVEEEELRVKDDRNSIFFFRVIFLLLILIWSLDFDEEKYKTWTEAYNAGVFDRIQLPKDVPRSAVDILTNHDKEMHVFWSAFTIADKKELESVVREYRRISRARFSDLSFPEPGGNPWLGRGGTLANLESYDGRRDKIEFYLGNCINGSSQSVIVYNGYSKKVYYGCQKMREQGKGGEGI